MSSGLELRVFDPTGATLTGYIAQGQDKQFVDSFNEPGFGQVTVPWGSPDADLLVRDAVVRVYYNSAAVFAWVVETLDRTRVDSDGRKIIHASGRGVLCWLDDAVVYPQGGLLPYTAPDRPFNYASPDGPWKVAGNWSAPLGVAWESDTTARAKNPAKWANVDRAAKWIWKTSPTAQNVPEGTVNWFRSTFTLTEPTKVRVWATADNSLQLYVDGTLAIDSADWSANAPTWSQFSTYTVDLGKGTHVLAARVRNGKPYFAKDLSVSKDDDKVSASGHGLVGGTKVKITDRSKSNGLTVGNTYYLISVTDNDFKLSTTAGGSAVDITADSTIDLTVQSDNTAGFLCAVRKMTNGKPGDLIRRTDTTNWEVTDVEPQWRPAMILKTLIQEAQARGVYRLSALNMSTFDTSTDSESTAWTTGVDMTLKCGVSLLQVLDEMVDLGVDFRVRPSQTWLDAYESRGADLSGTVRLFPGRNLLTYSTVAERKLKTAALVRSKDGWTVKNVNVDTYGRREMYVEVGRTRSEATARVVADRIIRRTGKVRITASAADAIPVPGADPYTDFKVGDLIGVPAPTGSGWSRARVLSIAMKDEAGTATYTPELEVLDA